MRRALCTLALSAALLAAACGGDAGGPKAGELVVNLATPGAGTRAVLFRLVGAQSSIAAATGTSYRVFTTSLGGDTVRVAVVAPRGSSLVAGGLVRLSVPDVGRAGSYTATASEAADAGYALQSTASFVLSVVKP